MKGKLMSKYQKSHYKSDYFGEGRNSIDRKKIKRFIKKSAKREFERDLKELIIKN